MIIDAHTALTGVLGYPVRHSLSPAMHNAAFQALGINWVYLAFEVAPDQLSAAIAGMRGLGLRGLNLTIPHKEIVRPRQRNRLARSTRCFGKGIV